jgi:hypothetical protein
VRVGVVVLLAGSIALAACMREPMPPVGVTTEPVDDRPAAPKPSASPDVTKAESPSEPPPPTEGSSEGKGEGPTAVEPPESPNACAPRDHGFGRYSEYVKTRNAVVAVPLLDGAERGRKHDVLLHFHFPDAVRRTFVDVAYPMVFAGINLGEGSAAYGRAFEDPSTFPALRDAILRVIRDKTGDPEATLGRFVLSSWSAGFAATTKILRQHPRAVDGVILLDSLYAPNARDASGEVREGTVYEPPLAPVLALARDAIAGKKSLFLSYSRTGTIGYASTEDVATYLLSKLHVPSRSIPADGNPRGLVRAADRGRFHVRGYGGGDARAHCNHLRYVREAIEAMRGGKEGDGDPRR